MTDYKKEVEEIKENINNNFYYVVDGVILYRKEKYRKCFYCYDYNTDCWVVDKSMSSELMEKLSLSKYVVKIIS